MLHIYVIFQSFSTIVVKSRLVIYHCGVSANGPQCNVYEVPGQIHVNTRTENVSHAKTISVHM